MPAHDTEARWAGGPRLPLIGLFVIAAAAALHFAHSLLLPIAAALILTLTLSPVVRRLRRLGLPRAAAAGLAVATLIGVIGSGVYFLAGPISHWSEAAPTLYPQVAYKLSQIMEPVEKLKEASKDVEKLADVGSGEDGEKVAVRQPALHERILDGLRDLLTQLIIVFGLSYFLLSSGSTLVRNAVRMLPGRLEQRRAVGALHECQLSVSRYLLAITAINAGLGVAIAIAMALCGMPNPELWGVAAALLNFAPYIGALLGVALVAAVALLSFDGLGSVFLVAGSYMLLTGLEGHIITPTLLGRRFTLNPLAIFLSLIFWGWIWGIPGLLLAVPILLSAKVFLDRSPRLAPIGALLQGDLGREAPARRLAMRLRRPSPPAGPGRPAL